jgi:hypothetical protein
MSKKINEDRLVETGKEILANSPNLSTDFALLHSVLCQVGLPRSKVEGTEYMTGTDRAWISLTAGKLDVGKGPEQQIIPYGPIPRLALAWVSTYAKRHGTREIPIGDSAAEFLRKMGMPVDGGKRYKMLRTQMHALAACTLHLGSQGRNFKGQPVEQFDAWVADNETRNHALWPGTMKLSHSYYNALIESGVPLDNRALKALSASSMALDIYTFLAYRLHHITNPVRVTWKQLAVQFGNSVMNAREEVSKEKTNQAVKDFSRGFKTALNRTLIVYPQAKVDIVRGGITMFPSPPPIAKKQVAMT